MWIGDEHNDEADVKTRTGLGGWTASRAILQVLYLLFFDKITESQI